MTARMRIPAAQIRPGDRFVVPAELFARGNETPSGGITLTVTDVEASGRGLFAGVAGLDMAVQEVFSGEHAWFSEIDSAASKVLAHWFPNVPNLGDITQIGWESVEPVDVLCGGFPCQEPGGSPTPPSASAATTIRIVGNGVCPQQAAHALNYLTAVAAN